DTRARRCHVDRRGPSPSGNRPAGDPRRGVRDRRGARRDDQRPARLGNNGPVSIRPAYSSWPTYNQRLRDAVSGLTDEQLALRSTPERWPMWATIGHTACQRVFWLCDFAGEPGADTTPFTNAGYDCPGDDDLEHVLGPAPPGAARRGPRRGPAPPVPSPRPGVPDRRALPRPMDARDARRDVAPARV